MIALLCVVGMYYSMADIEKAIQLATSLCVLFEGVSLCPYICPAGVPTIAVGATHYRDGTMVTLKDPSVTKEQALSLLNWMLRAEYMPAVIRLCPGIDTPSRLAAITDFAFNLGIARLRASTLRHRVNAGDWGGAKAECMKWTRGGGRVLPGLVKRRSTEAALL